MSWFQVLVLPWVALLFAGSVIRLVRGRPLRRLAAAGVVVWFVAGLAILRPTLTTGIANGIGIGRGADLVLYVVVLAVLGLASYFYSRMVRTEASISRIVRHLAIQEALAVPPEAKPLAAPEYRADHDESQIGH